MNIEIIVDNARKGGYNAILQLKNISTNEYNPYADRVLESIYYDGNKNHAVGTIYLREGIKEIKPEEFMNCKKLEKAIFPDTLQVIGKDAFLGCVRLTEITFKDNLIEICESAFYGCDALKKIKFPNSLTKISPYAFLNCDLTEIIFPSNLISIGRWAFQGNNKLERITYHRQTESILKKYFSNYIWSNLQKTVI